MKYFEFGQEHPELMVMPHGGVCYHDLIDPSVSGFFRFLARVGDGMMNMQIVKIGFGKAV